MLPQISDENFINMVVHPVVSEIEGFTDGSVELLQSDVTSSTKYPILTVREAETQILLKSHDTAVIGGLQTSRDSLEVQKVPLLGDIPFLGRLFRREVKTKAEIDLLIFIKATIIDRESYASASIGQQKEYEVSMKLTNPPDEKDAAKAASMDAPAKAAVTEAPAAEATVADASAQAPAPAASEVSDDDSREILEMVSDSDESTM